MPPMGIRGLQQATGLVGTLMSGLFLLLIGLLNLAIMAGIVRVLLQMRHGAYDEERWKSIWTTAGC